MRTTSAGSTTIYPTKKLSICTTSLDLDDFQPPHTRQPGKE